MMLEGKRRVRWTFVGRCQGVGFRWITQREAKKLNLVGWVQNQADGSVIMEVEGPSEAIPDLYAAIFNSYKDMPFKFMLDDTQELTPLNTESTFNVVF